MPEMKHGPAISKNAVTAAANWRAGNNRAPWALPRPQLTSYYESLWLNHGEIYRRANATATSPALILLFGLDPADLAQLVHQNRIPLAIGRSRPCGAAGERTCRRAECEHEFLPCRKGVS
jgi:hypothetical protein